MSLAVVQAGSACNGGNATVTLGSAPTQGNLLIAAGFTQGPPSGISGAWLPLAIAFDSGGSRYAVLWYKYAGASESATQSPSGTSQAAYGVTMWEISGVTGNIGQDFADVNAQYVASGTITFFTNSCANELVLVGSAMVGVSGAITIGISGGGTWTSDGSSTGTADGYNQAAHGWHDALSTSGNNVDPSITGTGGSPFADVYTSAIGVTSSPVTGCPYPVQAKVQVNSSGTNVSCTLNKAPASGNLLVATLLSFNDAPTVASGWTQDAQVSNSSGTGTTRLTTYYKYAGASESATQTPATGTSAANYQVSIQEITGVSGTWSKDHKATHITVQGNTGSGTAFSSFSTGQADTCVAGTVIGATGGTPYTSLSTGTPSHAWSLSYSGVSGVGQGVFYLEPSSGITINPSITSPSAWLGSAFFEIVNGGSSTETGNATIAIGAMNFAATDAAIVTTTGTIAISKMGLTAAALDIKERGAGTIAISKALFNVSAGVELPSASVGLAIAHPSFSVGVTLSDTVQASIAIGKITFQAADIITRLTQFSALALATNTVAIHLTQAALAALGKNTVNARVTQMALLVLAKGGDQPIIPNPLSLHDAGREQTMRERLINMYPEPTPQGPGTDARYQRGGLYSAAIRGGGSVQAIQHWSGPDPVEGDLSDPATNQFLYVISGGSVFRDDVNIGTVDPNIDPVWFPTGRRISVARSQTQFMIASNGILYSADLDSVVQVPVGGILPAGVRDIAFLAGRFVYILNDNSGEFYYSAIGDGTSIDGLNFATASEDDPLPLLAAWDLSDDLCFFTTETVEFWYASADPNNPYQRSIGRRYNKGLLAQNSVELIDNSLFWLGHDRIIYRTGLVPARVSNYDVEDRIRRLTDDEVQQCYAYGITFGGHNFYVIHLMSQGTWVLDIGSKTWAQWQSWEKDRFRGYCTDDTHHIIGDYFSGNVMGLDGGIYTDLGQPLERICSAYFPLQKGRLVNFNCILHTTRGVGQPAGPDDNTIMALVEMRFSDHEGHDFTPWIAESMGEQGDREIGSIPTWGPLGGMTPPGRLFEFRCTGAIFFAPYKLRVNEEFV